MRRTVSKSFLLVYLINFVLGVRSKMLAEIRMKMSHNACDEDSEFSHRHFGGCGKTKFVDQIVGRFHHLINGSNSAFEVIWKSKQEKQEYQQAFMMLINQFLKEAKLTAV